MTDINKVIKMLENFKLKVIAEAEDSEHLMQTIIQHLKNSLPVKAGVVKKTADISEIVRQAKLKAAHKHLGDYQQSYIWAGDIEKFTKELEENIASDLKSIFLYNIVATYPIMVVAN